MFWTDLAKKLPISLGLFLLVLIAALAVPQDTLVWMSAKGILVVALCILLGRTRTNDSPRENDRSHDPSRTAAERLITEASAGESGSYKIAALGSSFKRMAQSIDSVLQDAREELDLAQAKSDFLVTASHELRTPVTSIRSCAEILLKYGDAETTDTEEFLGIIRSESVRLTTLIHKILDLAKLEAGMTVWSLSDVDLGDVIRTSVEATKGTYHALSGELTVDLTENAPYSGDLDRIPHVFINLLENAVKFSEQPAKVTIALRDLSGGYEVRVSDEGRGVPDREKTRIFEKFVQGGDILTNKPSGMGLGLSVAKEIVTVHDGEIRCEDNKDGGATFVVFLPRASKRSPRAIDSFASDVEVPALSFDIN